MRLHSTTTLTETEVKYPSDSISVVITTITDIDNLRGTYVRTTLETVVVLGEAVSTVLRSEVGYIL